MTKKQLVESKLRQMVRSILKENLSPSEEKLIQYVIDTHNHTRSGKMAVDKREYNTYKKISDKSGFVVVYSGFPKGTYSVGMTDKGIKHYNLTSK